MEFINDRTKPTSEGYYLKSRVGQVAFFIFTILFSIACQKNNSSNDTLATPVIVNPNQIVPGNCVQCNFPQVQLIQAVSQGTSSFPVTVNWQIIADQVKVQQILAMGWNPQKTYSGPVIPKGTLTVASGQNSYNNFNGIIAGQCQIPAGNYEIYPIQVGMMNIGSFEFPQFEAILGQGSVRVVFQLTNAIVEDPNGDGQVDQIAGQLVPTQANFNGGLINCNHVGVYIQ